MAEERREQEMVIVQELTKDDEINSPRSMQPDDQTIQQDI
jgi:hypothetical protein